MSWLGGRPYLFREGGIDSYTALLFLGLVGGVVAGNAAAHRADLDTGRVAVAQLLLVPFALLGARALYVLFYRRRFQGRPWFTPRARQGGAALIGGLPVILLLSIPLLALLRLPFWRFWDVSAFTILVGILIGRGGCLLRGCCCGRETEGPLGLLMANAEGVVRRRFPTQLLDMGFVALVLLAAVRLQPRIEFAGGLFCAAIGAYTAGRVVLEPLREEVHPWLGPVTANQGIYGAATLLCLLGWAWLG